MERFKSLGLLRKSMASLMNFKCFVGFQLNNSKTIIGAYILNFSNFFSHKFIQLFQKFAQNSYLFKEDVGRKIKNNHKDLI